MTELFATEFRYSGASLGYQIGAICGGGFAPLIATALFAKYHTSMAISVYMAGLCAGLAGLGVPAGRDPQQGAPRRDGGALGGELAGGAPVGGGGGVELHEVAHPAALRLDQRAARAARACAGPGPRRPSARRPGAARSGRRSAPASAARLATFERGDRLLVAAEVGEHVGDLDEGPQHRLLVAGERDARVGLGGRGAAAFSVPPWKIGAVRPPRIVQAAASALKMSPRLDRLLRQRRPRA